jgi:hypothetical protein
MRAIRVLDLGVKILALKAVSRSGCLSKIPDPDFYPSRILYFLGRKKFRPVYKNCTSTGTVPFTSKIVIKFSKIWVGDPVSGKTYSGSHFHESKSLRGTESRIPDYFASGPNPFHRLIWNRIPDPDQGF